LIKVLTTNKVFGYLVAASLVTSAGLYLAVRYLIHHIPFLSNPVVSLYVGHLQRGLIAFPIVVAAAWSCRVLHIRPETIPQRLYRRLEPYYPFVMLAIFFILLLFIANFAYQRIPQGDAVGVFFQTKTFALGKLYVAPPVYPQFFTMPAVIVHNSKWFCFYSPGHALILLVGYLLRLTWLVGPVLGVMSLYLMYSVARMMYGFTVARKVLALGVFSPFLLFLSATHDFHTGSVFFTTVCLFLVSKMEVRDRPYLSPLLGLSVGFVFLCRPYTGFLIGLTILIYLAARQPRRIVGYLAGGIPVVILHMIYNQALMGNPFTLPYQALASYHGVGFSPDYGGATFGLTGHSLLKAAVNLFYNLFVLSIHLFGWPILAGATILLLFLFKKDSYHYLLLGTIGSLFGGHLLYWFHGIAPYGPKYISEALPAFIILSAKALDSLPLLLTKTKKDGDLALVRESIPRFVFLLVLSNLLVYLPFQFQYFRSGQWGENPKIWQAVTKAGVTNAVVFVTERSERNTRFFSSAFIFNDPELKGDIIFARDLGPENDKLIKCFPKRNLCLIDQGDLAVKPYAPKLNSR